LGKGGNHESKKKKLKNHERKFAPMLPPSENKTKQKFSTESAREFGA
jgi:hypothetical protein